MTLRRTATKTVILLAAVLPAAASAATASAAQQPVTVLRLLAIETGAVASTPGEAEPTFGDRVSLHQVFYRWHGHKGGVRIGSGDVTGIVAREAISFSAVAHLPGGTLQLLGVATPARVNTYAVVGGTGRYAGARGEMVARALGGESSGRQALTIRLSA
jgi:hypothetical protein